MSTLSTDAREWLELANRTPQRPPEAEADRQALQPGTCVKSADLCGIVHRHDAGGAVVIGHGWTTSSSERFVWRGTAEEFTTTWTID